MKGWVNTFDQGEQGEDVLTVTSFYTEEIRGSLATTCEHSFLQTKQVSNLKLLLISYSCQTLFLDTDLKL